MAEVNGEVGSSRVTIIIGRSLRADQTRSEPSLPPNARDNGHFSAQSQRAGSHIWSWIITLESKSKRRAGSGHFQKEMMYITKMVAAAVGVNREVR
jgi:hypothetical protein